MLKSSGTICTDYLERDQRRGFGLPVELHKAEVVLIIETGVSGRIPNNQYFNCSILRMESQRLKQQRMTRLAVSVGKIAFEPAELVFKVQGGDGRIGIRQHGGQFI